MSKAKRILSIAAAVLVVTMSAIQLAISIIDSNEKIKMLTIKEND